MKKFSLSKPALATSTIAALLILALLSYIAFTPDTQIFHVRNPIPVTTNQTYEHHVIEDETSPTGVVNVYTWEIGSDLREGTTLGIFSYHQYIRVYIDDIQFYSLTDYSRDEITHTPGNTWCFVPLHQEDIHKQIRIEVTPVYNNAVDRAPEFYMGFVQNIFLAIAQRELCQIILCALTILVGFIFAMVGLYGYIANRKGKTLIAHGGFSIMLGIWRLFDTRTVPMLFSEHTVFLYYCSVCMLALCAVPLLKALSRRVSRFCGQILNACCILCASTCIIQLLLQILGILDLRQMLVCTHLSIILSSLVTIPTLAYDGIAFRQPLKEQHNKLLMFTCVPGL